MNVNRFQTLVSAFGALTLCVSAAPGADFNWQVVVNNGVKVPGDSRTFNSYNQPSVNVNRLLVFRARSKGGQNGEPAHGVFVRNMASPGAIITIFDRNAPVPPPDNLGSTFVEPPSFPRIDMWSNTIASRGNHQPVWDYFLSDGTETRAGTTGIYSNPFGNLVMGASNLGAVPDFRFFAVPGTGGSVKFDVFPGAPSVTDGATLVFKGNYTAGVAQTGVYYRDLANELAGGTGDAVLIADTSTLIPDTNVKFGSTAPPSAVGRLAVFAGFDNEENPNVGGIYLAPLTPNGKTTALVNIGGRVPGEKNTAVFNKLGEGVSFDGRFVAFWGAWGTETNTVTLFCTGEGNKDRAAYCKDHYPDGYVTAVPVHQGIFVHDTVTGLTSAVAKTPGDFDDFIYWNFSGMVPGMSESDDTGEPARWRAATFVAVSGLVDGQLSDVTFHVAFKARKSHGAIPSYVDGRPLATLAATIVDGIYLRKGPGKPPMTTVLETGMDGTLIDPAAIDPLTQEHLPVTAIGLERDGFRGNSLALNVSMGTEAAGWAGIYLGTVPMDLTN